MAVTPQYNDLKQKEFKVINGEVAEEGSQLIITFLPVQQDHKNITTTCTLKY